MRFSSDKENNHANKINVCRGWDRYCFCCPPANRQQFYGVECLVRAGTTSPGEDDIFLNDDTILKPGEATDFLPTPLPPMTPPQDAIALTPGQLDSSNWGTQSTMSIPPEPSPTINPDAPWINAGIAEVVPWDSKQIALWSDVVVLANMIDSKAQWSTVDGKRPINPHSSDSRDYIFSTASVEVTQVFSGNVTIGDILHIRQNGGQIGEDKLEILYDHTFLVVGEYVLLYLSAKTDPETQASFYIAQEKYIVDESTQTVTNPFFTKSLSAIYAEVEEAKRIKQEIREGKFTPPPPPQN